MSRIYWFTAGRMDSSGGGERVILEGMDAFRRLGHNVILVMVRRNIGLDGLFDGRYEPEVMELDPGEGGNNWWRIRRNLARLLDEARRGAILLANGPDECVLLMVARLLFLRRKAPFAAFIHGSKFQFPEDQTKYSLVYRRHFRQVRDADEVYRQMIPLKPGRMGLRRRLDMELREFMRFLAVRSSLVVFSFSRKNTAEIEQFYGHGNVRSLRTLGLTRQELTEPLPEVTLPDSRLKGKRVIFSLCRLEKKKRVDFILRSFARLLANGRYADALLVIGGNGPEGESLEALAGHLGIQAAVHFAGFIPEKDLDRWYQACEVFAQADNADFDLTSTKAIGMGRKVVLTDQHELPEGLSRLRRFVFVSASNEESYARTLATALDEEVPSLGREDIEEAGALSWEEYFLSLLRAVQKRQDDSANRA